MGCGPCGELRFPAYPEANGWRFPVRGRQHGRRRWRAGVAAAAGAPKCPWPALPSCSPLPLLTSHPPTLPPPCPKQGVGEFQCYDRRALASLAAAAREAGHPEWGNTGAARGRQSAGPPAAASTCRACAAHPCSPRAHTPMFSPPALPPALPCLLPRCPLQAPTTPALTTPRLKTPASSAAGAASGRRPTGGERLGRQGSWPGHCCGRHAVATASGCAWHTGRALLPAARAPIPTAIPHIWAPSLPAPLPAAASSWSGTAGRCWSTASAC